MAAGGVPLPSLNLSSGPAVSDAVSGGSSVQFAPFYERQSEGIIQRALPLVLVGGVVWLLTR